MHRRSRAGCVDCRKAKVKCDEEKPSCGTCARRGKDCHGYITHNHQKPLKWVTTACSIEGPPTKRRRSSAVASPGEREPHVPLHSTSSDRSRADVPLSSASPSAFTSTTWISYLDSPHIAPGLSVPGHANHDEREQQAVASMPKRNSSEISAFSTSHGSMESVFIVPRSYIPKELSFFLNSNITPDISQGVEIYFARHPAELVIGSESVFIHEMNTHVLSVLQSNVEMVSDSLCAIGSVYLQNEGVQSGLELALDSKIKTLARIRKINDANIRDLKVEQIFSMILALVSMELIDAHHNPAESSMSALHVAAAAIINQFLSAGIAFSPIARYMIRALARENMVISLVYQKRPLIPTSTWFGDDCENSADRFMGFTMTLMHLLEELGGLAEDWKEEHQRHSRLYDSDIESAKYTELADAGNLLDIRAEHLRTRISLWHPPFVATFSGPASSKFLLHAGMYRSGALLYLHRILHPHGSSPGHDDEALVLAYDIFAHLSSEPRDNRLALFPIFLAACEFKIADDRCMAGECFDAIHKSRNTYTTWLTGWFVKERVWKARDGGEEWSWLKLVDRWKGECVPI